MRNENLDLSSRREEKAEDRVHGLQKKRRQKIGFTDLIFILNRESKIGVKKACPGCLTRDAVFQWDPPVETPFGAKPNI